MVLAICTKILATHQIANRHQCSIANVKMGILTDDDELKTICMNGSIISEDGTATSQSKEILASFAESVKLLDEWRAETIAMFPDNP